MVNRPSANIRLPETIILKQQTIIQKESQEIRTVQYFATIIPFVIVFLPVSVAYIFGDNLPYVRIRNCVSSFIHTKYRCVQRIILFVLLLANRVYRIELKMLKIINSQFNSCECFVLSIFLCFIRNVILKHH